MDSKTKVKITFPPKPVSSIFKGGFHPTAPFGFGPDINTIHTIRDGYELSTWLLVGAALQCILFLPILNLRPSYAMLPALGLLSWRIVRGVMMCLGLIRHPYADGVISGKMAGVMPLRAAEAEGMGSKGVDDEDGGGMCVIMLFARCHSPLGILSPHYSALNAYTRTLLTNLETCAPQNGFLGGSSFANTCDRTSCSEVLTIMYFTSHARLQAFAHGEDHRAVWEWWRGLVRDGKAKGLSTAHEVFRVRKGDWEGVYANYFPSLFGATQHLVKKEVGDKEDGYDYKWVSPLVDAKDKLRSAMGRMGRSDGADNVKYGEEPYMNVLV